MDIVKIEQGKTEINLIDCNLREIINDCINFVDKIAKAQEIDINIGDIDYFIKADPVRSKQIFTNLLTNAVKYNKRGGKIFVDAIKTAEGSINISITDTGVGISEQDFEAVFEPFSRLTYALNSSIEGVGIGLSLTKQLVDEMQGRISIESVEGECTTFTVQLAQGKNNVNIDRVKKDVVAESGQKKKVLYIEDNPQSRDLFDSYFEMEKDVTLLLAKNAKEGITLAQTTLPDIIFIDINLPDESGIHVLEELKKNDNLQRSRMYALSADAMPEQVDYAMSAGFEAYLTKPVNFKEIGLIVSKAS